MTKDLGLVSSVVFHGSVENSDLPELLVGVDAFVSTLTGTSLREAALCRLPILAYDRDWIHGLLVHEETALLIAPGDIEGFANAVIRLAENPQLRQTLADNVYQLALTFWSVSALKDALAELDRALSSCSRPEKEVGVSA